MVLGTPPALILSTVGCKGKVQAVTANCSTASEAASLLYRDVQHFCLTLPILFFRWFATGFGSSQKYLRVKACILLHEEVQIGMDIWWLK